MPTYRSDAALAAQHLRTQWSELRLLRAAARVIAESVRRAHAEAPASWSLTLFDHFLRLNVGQIAVLELFADELVLYTVSGPPVRGPAYERIEHEYRAVAVPTERWAVSMRAVPELDPALAKRHHALIEVAAHAKRVSPFKKSHSPGAITALASLAGGQIPQPELNASAAEDQPVAGAGFGKSEENRKVEEAAVKLVSETYRREGWQVVSVEEKRCGFDLHCVRDREEAHVEVKGVAGAERRFVITAGELRCALDDDQFVLALVTSALSSQPCLERLPAARFRNGFTFDPIQYWASPTQEDGRVAEEPNRGAAPDRSGRSRFQGSTAHRPPR